MFVLQNKLKQKTHTLSFKNTRLNSMPVVYVEAELHSPHTPIRI